MALVMVGVGLLIGSQLRGNESRITKLEDAEDQRQRREAKLDAVIVSPVEDETHPPGTDPTVRSVDITDSEKVQRAIAAGLRYWHRRGKLPCPDPRVYRLDVLVIEGRRAAGAATFGGCVIWLDQLSREDYGDRADCSLFLHEQGHLSALTFDPHPVGDPYHAVEGLMSPSGDGVVPGACRAEFARP